MKKHILTALAMTAAFGAMAQDYQVVVTTTDGEKRIFTSDQVGSIRFSDASDYIEAPSFYDGEYNLNGDRGRYAFIIGRGSADAQGEPKEEGDFMLQLTLSSPAAENAADPQLYDAFYSTPYTSSKYYFEPTKTGMFVRVNGEVQTLVFADGGVDVRVTDAGYEVRADLTAISGDQIHIRYSGPMEFTPGASTAGSFNTDQNIEFTSAAGRWWGNWFCSFSDDMALSLATDSRLDSDEVNPSGYLLYLDLYLPKDNSHGQDWTPVMNDGVYNVDAREKVLENTYLPFTYRPGSMINFWGELYPSGTYLEYKGQDGSLKRALISGGTITVSENGSKVVVDLVADNGIKVQGTYSGATNIVNYQDNKAPEIPDAIPEDVALSFPSNAVALDYNMGDYIIDGLYSHVLMLTDPQMLTGDYLSLQLFNANEELSNGTYTIQDTLADMTGLTGRVDVGGNILYSWYGDLDSSDSEGYQTILGPVTGGTIKVSGEGASRTFEIDLVTYYGKRLTGTVMLPFHAVSDESQAPAKVRRQAPTLKRALRR